MSWGIKIFYFLLNGLSFCFFTLLDFNWLCFHSSSRRGKHIIIISLRIAYIINVHNRRLRCYWPIQILIVLNFSLVITWWYWRYQISSLVRNILDSVLNLIIGCILVWALVNDRINSALILFRKMFWALYIINIFIYFANII